MNDDEVASSRLGNVLCDKWTLEKLVGVGGMAAVYVARHKIGRLDAIKILHPEYARSEQVRARFEQEAHVLNKFKHPGAVEVRDLEKTPDGAPFIVMELLEGKSLATVIREKPPTVEQTLRMADEVLDVLAAAHAQGIIHRDIKPDNLFVLPNGSIKVLDFGIAQLRGDERQLKTKTGTTLGTVAYMPSEQLKGLDIDARADVYGVGATMFRMLTGKTPHEAASGGSGKLSDVELMMKVLTEPAPRIASVAPVRGDVAKIVDRALAFDRDARHPNARAMQTEVREARGAKDVPLAEPPIAFSGPPSGSEAPTRTPANIAVPIIPAAAVSAPEIAPTMHAAPESALLRESVPQSRAVTSVVPVSQPKIEEEKKNEIAGVPILWLIIGGIVAALGLLALLTMAGAALFRDKAAAPTATTTPTQQPTIAYPPPQPTPSDDEDREEHHPPPPGKGHGHGKHKP